MRLRKPRVPLHIWPPSLSRTPLFPLVFFLSPFSGFLSDSRHLLDNTKNISGMNGLCINTFIYCSERPGFIYLGRRVSILSRERRLTAVLPEKQSCFGACGTTRSPFTTFAVVLEECVLRPSSCAMENSTSLLVAVSSYAAVWYRRQSERGRERKKAWPLESLQQGYLCRASQFPGPAGISPRE